MTTRWHMIDGPAITPLQALENIADAPVIALLMGSEGASLIWYDTPIAVDDPAAFVRGWAIASERLAALRQPHVAPADPRFGLTWCDVPPESLFVQCDYEFPQATPRVIAAPHVVRWDASGKCWLLGLDEAVLAWMKERMEGPATIPDPRWHERQSGRAGARPSQEDASPSGRAGARPSQEEPPEIPRTTTIAPLALSEPFMPAWDADGHRERVVRIKDYIAAGDCYQVNLAVPFRGRFANAPHRDIAAFTALMSQSPGPFSAFFRTPGRPSVVSHSPECLLSVRGDQLTSLPIKGTRRRIAGREDELWTELRAAAKDDAELAMIVDLVRNDLGRAAVTGSVRVSDPAVRLDLPYVIHRAARIDARLRPGLTTYDALMASFPAGSITGAPKHRVMEIISELEGGPRGAYCGTFGWLGPGGGDFSVAIRTAEIDGDAITLYAGGGIVWDSDPQAEWDEVRAKASGMARALGGEV